MRHERAREEKPTVVRAPGPFEGILLIEVARNCGYPARFQPGSLTRVAVKASEDQLNRMADKLGPAIRLFDLRRWEAVAEAVLAVGGEPTQTLLNTLIRARRQTEAFLAAEEGQGGLKNLSNN
jgi:hypothetical protein